jgi:hypothetical protein
MSTANIDESSHEQGRVVLAGFIGNDEQWETFRHLWKKGLGSQRERLHTKSLRWKKAATKELLKRLAPIPFHCGLRPVYGTIVDSDFSDLLEDDLDRSIHKPYPLALLPMVLSVINEIPQAETIRFIFDQQLEYEGVVRLMFQVLKNYKTPQGHPSSQVSSLCIKAH